MHVQDVMAELDAREVGFDVLTPTHELYEMLQEARASRSPPVDPEQRWQARDEASQAPRRR